MPFQTLIDAHTLAERRTEHWVLVDCRFSLSDTERGRKAYGEAHIPGAVYAHLDEDLSGPIVKGETGRHPWPTVAAATALVRSWGVGQQSQVVVYDDFGGAIAARAWWMLRWLGHDAVAVLDGGFPAWQAAGLPVESGTVAANKKGDFQPNTRTGFITDVDHVDRLRQDPAFALIDARGAKRFAGEEEPIDPVAGHIPGATSSPFPENLDREGRFKDAETLRHRFAPFLEGRDPQKVVIYCGSGVTACHNLLAMKHAGLGDGCLYTESWSGWIANGKRPIATGT